jgi:hypothetical protein
MVSTIATSRFLTILSGRNLPKIQQPGEPAPSTINEKTSPTLRGWSNRPAS